MIKAILLLVVAHLVLGCGSRTDDLSGEWLSPPHDTEWGEMIFALSLKPDGTCTLHISSPEQPDAELLTSQGAWQSSGKTSGTIVWQNDKPDASITISAVNPTTIKLSLENDVVILKKKIIYNKVNVDYCRIRSKV